MEPGPNSQKRQTWRKIFLGQVNRLMSTAHLSFFDKTNNYSMYGRLETNLQRLQFVSGQRFA